MLPPPLALAGFQPYRRNGLKTLLVPSFRHSEWNVQTEPPCRGKRSVNLISYEKYSYFIWTAIKRRMWKLPLNSERQGLRKRKYTAEGIRNDQRIFLRNSKDFSWLRNERFGRHLLALKTLSSLHIHLTSIYWEQLNQVQWVWGCSGE